MKNLEENTINELKARIPVEVGNQVKKFREKKKLTQTELAVMIGKDRQYLYKIEKGKVTPNIFTIALIASALEVSLSELMKEIS